MPVLRRFFVTISLRAASILLRPAAMVIARMQAWTNGPEGFDVRDGGYETGLRKKTEICKREEGLNASCRTHFAMRRKPIRPTRQ